MRLLLDTHIALWAVSDAPALSQQARALILEPKNDIFVSVASLWEISIKHALGRKAMPISGKEAQHWFEQSGYYLLPIEPAHATGIETLPLIHGDPFDRLLISQALFEPLRLVTHDTTVAQYNDTIMLV